jgi:hypothetical protein
VLFVASPWHVYKDVPLPQRRGVVLMLDISLSAESSRTGCQIRPDAGEGPCKTGVKALLLAGCPG